MISDRITDLIDELDQEIRTLETSKALAAFAIKPELAVLAVQGLKLLLEGKIGQASEIFIALSEELVDRTLKIK